MFVKLLVISLVFIIVAFAGLGISILIRSHGRFPETHVGRNKNMRKLGISCAQNTDTGCNPGAGYEGCSTCGVKKI